MPSNNLPSDEHVRRLLAASRASQDPRIAPATTFILSLGCTETDLNRTSWPDIDLASGLVSRGRGEQSRQQLTELAVRQLLALLPYRSGRWVFRATGKFPMPLHDALAQVLLSANLNMYSISDFARWSQLQSPQVRCAVATAA